MSVRFGLAALAAAMLLGVGQDAKAVFAPIYQGTTALGGGQYRWDYAIDLEVTPATAPSFGIQGGGAISVGTFGTADFVTLYDIEGLVSATSTNPNFVVDSTPFTGINGPAQAPPDLGSLRNITFRYTGPAQTNPTSYTGLSFISTVPGTFANPLGWYSSQYTRFDNSTKLGESGRVTLPGIIPEPSSVALIGMGVAGLFGYGYRRRRQG